MTEDWDKVLDLFSGSGALGIEALSRGAGWVDFVEREPKVCETIKENLEKTNLSEYSHVYCTGVTKALSFLDKQYSIILCDPPYKNPNIGALLQQLADSKLVGPNTIVVATYPDYRPLGPLYGNLKMVKDHRHGDSCLAVYRREAAA